MFLTLSVFHLRSCLEENFFCDRSIHEEKKNQGAAKIDNFSLSRPLARPLIKVLVQHTAMKLPVMCNEVQNACLVMLKL